MKSNIFCFLSLFSCSLGICQSGTIKLDSLFSEGVQSYEQGNYGKAIELFSEIILNDPTDLNSLYSRAAAYYKISDLQLACNDWGTGNLFGDSIAGKKIYKYCDYYIFDNTDTVYFRNITASSIAEFPGGEKKLMEFLAKNIKYPRVDLENGVRGTVFLSFVVKASGEIKFVKVLHGLSPTIDQSAINVINSMPKWTPATLNGKAIPMLYNLPIRFWIGD